MSDVGSVRTPSEIRDELHALEAWADLAFGALDSKGAARWLACSEAKFAKIAPEIPRSKVGKEYRYLRSDLMAWLHLRRKREQPGGNAKPSFAPGRKPGNLKTERLVDPPNGRM